MKPKCGNLKTKIQVEMAMLDVAQWNEKVRHVHVLEVGSEGVRVPVF